MYMRKTDENLTILLGIAHDYGLDIKRIFSRLDSIDQRIDKMDARFTQRFEEVDKRFDAMDKRMDEMDAKFTQRFEAADKRMDEMDTKLDQHTAVLDQHTTVLDQHTVLLNQILERLPAHS